MNSSYSGFGVTLSICDNILSRWASHRQLSLVTTEACGVLIGGYDVERDHFIIHDVTVPLPGDVRSHSFFTMKDKGHQEAVNDAFEASEGKHIYLGTWHTHPERCPTPSSVDIRDWNACIKRNEGRQLFFVIVGTEEVRVFVQSDNQFESMTLTEGVLGGDIF